MSVKYCRFLFLLIVVAGFPLFSGVAQAETKIGVVNIQKIMTESKAAQSIQNQLETHRKSFQDEFSKHERELVDQEKNIIEARAELSAEEFAKKRQEFEGKVLETRKLVQTRQRSLEKAAGEALAKLRKEVFQIVADMADKDGYDLVVTRQNVILAHKSMDITDGVMKGLDKSLKKVELKVEKK